MTNALIPSTPERTVVSVVPPPAPYAFLVVTIIASFNENLEEHTSPVNQATPIKVVPGGGKQL